MQLECCQTEVEFVRKRLKQTEEKLETERETRQQLEDKVGRWDAVTYAMSGDHSGGCVCACAGNLATGPAGAVQKKCDRAETAVPPCDL